MRGQDPYRKSSAEADDVTHTKLNVYLTLDAEVIKLLLSVCSNDCVSTNIETLVRKFLKLSFDHLWGNSSEIF